jgi:nucleoid-associated protein YgaU
MIPPPDAASPAQPSTIEAVIAGGRTVRVGADADTGALVRIVAALEAAR